MRPMFVIERNEAGAFLAKFLMDGEPLFVSFPCPTMGRAKDIVELLREHAPRADIRE